MHSTSTNLNHQLFLVAWLKEFQFDWPITKKKWFLGAMFIVTTLIIVMIGLMLFNLIALLLKIIIFTIPFVMTIVNNIIIRVIAITIVIIIAITNIEEASLSIISWLNLAAHRVTACKALWLKSFDPFQGLSIRY